MEAILAYASICRNYNSSFSIDESTLSSNKSESTLHQREPLDRTVFSADKATIYKYVQLFINNCGDIEVKFCIFSI